MPRDYCEQLLAQGLPRRFTVLPIQPGDPWYKVETCYDEAVVRKLAKEANRVQAAARARPKKLRKSTEKDALLSGSWSGAGVTDMSAAPHHCARSSINWRCEIA